MTIVPVQNLSTWQNLIGLIFKKVMLSYLKEFVFFFFLSLCDIFRKTGNRRRNTTGTFPRKWVIALPLFWGHMIVVWLYQQIKDSHFHFRIVKIFTRAYNSSQWNPISRSGRRRAGGYIEYNTWALVDMEFLFECLTRFDSSRVRCQVEHEKRNSISTSNHVLCCLSYKHHSVIGETMWTKLPVGETRSIRINWHFFFFRWLICWSLIPNSSILVYMFLFVINIFTGIWWLLWHMSGKYMYFFLFLFFYILYLHMYLHYT